MGKQHASRFRDLFAERQIFLRTGQTSQYVVLSRSLQWGVALSAVLLVAGIGLIGYSALTSHLAVHQQARQISQLRAQNERLAVDAEAAKRLPLMAATLEQSELAAVEARQQAESAVAEVTDLMSEIKRAEAQIEDLRGRLSEAKAEQAALTARLEARGPDAAAGTAEVSPEVAGLQRQLEATFREVETLRLARDEAHRQVATSTAALQEQSRVADGERRKLDQAKAEIVKLRDQVGDAERAGAEARVAVAGELDALQRQVAELTEARNGLQAQIETLNGELGRRDAELARQAGALRDARAEIEQLKHSVVEADAAKHAVAIAYDVAEAELQSKLEALAPDGRANGVAMAVAHEQDLLGEARAGRVVDGAGQDAHGAADSQQVSRLQHDLAGARGEIAKLNAELRDARAELATDGADRTPPRPAAAHGVAGSASELQSELETAKARLVELNDALAEAKLREVAFELALVSVVPSPSPPAPR